MGRHRFRMGLSAVALLGAPFAACAVARSSEPAQKSSSALERATLPDRFEVTLPWGAGPKSVRLLPAETESMAQGPNAVAALPGGEVLVLDRLAGRVAKVEHDGAIHTVASVARDAEELVSGADGSFVAFSPMRAAAWFFDEHGKSAGELAVPRELRELRGLSIGKSRRLSVHTGYQETLIIGSPSAPIALPVVLSGKREGAYQLPSGLGAAVRIDSDRAVFVVVSQSTQEARSKTVRSFMLPHSASAARVIGGEGDRVCLRTELVTSTPSIDVSRRAICIDAGDGAIAFDEALPARGLYLPRTELSVGGGRLVFAHPTPQGFVITSSRIGKEVP